MDWWKWSQPDAIQSLSHAHFYSRHLFCGGSSLGMHLCSDGLRPQDLHTIHICIYSNTYMHTYKHACMHMSFIFMFVHIYIYMYIIYICIYTHWFMSVYIDFCQWALAQSALPPFVSTRWRVWSWVQKPLGVFYTNKKKWMYVCILIGKNKCLFELKNSEAPSYVS